MALLKRRLTAFYSSLGPRYLPFADVTTPDLTLARLLRLVIVPDLGRHDVRPSRWDAQPRHDRRARRSCDSGRHHDCAATFVCTIAVRLSVISLTRTAANSAGGACPTYGAARCFSSAAMRLCRSRSWCWRAAAKQKTRPSGSDTRRRRPRSCWSVRGRSHRPDGQAWRWPRT